MGTVMSRRMRRVAAGTAAAVLVLLAVASRTGCIGRAAHDERQRYHNRSFKVLKVVDGDTLDLAVADVKTGKKWTRVRLWGVDTPETKHPQLGKMYYGPEAAELTRALALNESVTVSLEPFRNTRGKYGRLLAYIYLPDGTMLNEQLIIQGCGYADERFEHMLKKRFSNLQHRAQSEKRGLWRDVRPHQWPPWYRKRHDPDYTHPTLP